MIEISSSYRDFSRVPDVENDSQSSSIYQGKKNNKEPKFPVKLHMILSNPEFQDAISWLPHGRSWRIIDQKKIEDHVIPLFFHHAKFPSFARQVNGWGFVRITTGNDSNSYYHELFLRGKPHLCNKMKRLTTKDLAVRKKKDNCPPPDFYEVSRNNPLPQHTPLPTDRPEMRIPVTFEDRFRLVNANMFNQLNFLSNQQNAYNRALASTRMPPANMQDLLSMQGALAAANPGTAAALFSPFGAPNASILQPGLISNAILLPQDSRAAIERQLMMKQRQAFSAALALDRNPANQAFTLNNLNVGGEKNCINHSVFKD